jgi:hypothetical protein
MAQARTAHGIWNATRSARDGRAGAKLDGKRVLLCAHQAELQHFALAGGIDEWVFQVYSDQAHAPAMAAE